MVNKYKKNKEKLQTEACGRYQNLFEEEKEKKPDTLYLSEEEKDKKHQHYHNQNKNLFEEEKQG